jgi:tetratricopeptide (TPR) repeat protein
MRTVIVVLGTILINVSTARPYTWKAVCNVGADYALGLEDYSEAIRLHQQLLTLHPGNALAHYHLGFAYGMTGRSEDEIREYLAAASLGANDWDLYLNLGVAYLGLGNFGKSIESLRHGFCRLPGSTTSFTSISVSHTNEAIDCPKPYKKSQPQCARTRWLRRFAICGRLFMRSLAI